jgi:hypothetical protein
LNNRRYPSRPVTNLIDVPAFLVALPAIRSKREEAFQKG